MGISKLTSDVILISQNLKWEEEKGDSGMHSCTKGIYIAGSHHTLTIEAKDTMLSPGEGSGPSPTIPTPINHNKARSLMISTASLCSESIIQHMTQRKERGRKEEEEVIS